MGRVRIRRFRGLVFAGPYGFPSCMVGGEGVVGVSHEGSKGVARVGDARISETTCGAIDDRDRIIHELKLRLGEFAASEGPDIFKGEAKFAPTVSQCGGHGICRQNPTQR
jgi:hypothetical protein